MLDECLEQAVAMLNVLQMGECRSVIEHPHISNADKRKFLGSIFVGAHENMTGFLYLLIAKSYENLIVPALEAFIKMVKLRGGKITANVVSAMELKESQISAIKDVLSKKLRKEVEILPRTDLSLIGGFYVSVDGRLIDCTVKKYLGDLRDHIKKGVLDDHQA
jgi:F-type H+-transporting ATPase subunit delta